MPAVSTMQFSQSAARFILLGSKPLATDSRAVLPSSLASKTILWSHRVEPFLQSLSICSDLERGWLVVVRRGGVLDRVEVGLG